jgi:8-oxo-dGTP pyrophosphatase MutT (NUDIX family)
VIGPPRASGVAPVPAATVVLLRPGLGGPEVLLIHRPSTMAFGPGLHVFPGGRVDPEDRDPAVLDTRAAGGPAGAAVAAARVLGGNLAPGDALAVQRAALRELHEEAGVTLAGIDRLVPIAHWTTPPFMPRRFSTWFFVADLPPGAVPVFSEDEVAAHRWLTPSAALDQVATGEIAMWVPTTSVLERLLETGAGTAAAVRERIRFGPTPPPSIDAVSPAVTHLTFGAVGAVPGRVGRGTIVGRRELVLVDPGDPSDAALDAIAAVVDERGGSIRAIVLTATDPDHAAGAEAVAIPLEISILVAPGAGRHLPYATRELADGERLPADIDVRARLEPAGSGRLEIEVRPVSAGK